MSKNGGHLTVQYNLRLDEHLKTKIANSAKLNTRSMNQEIISRLEKSYLENFDEGSIPLEKLLSMVMEKLDDHNIELIYKKKPTAM